jgi:hypothetical protein
MSRIRGEKLKLLDAAVQQGRATDLGEMSVSEWSGLPGKGLDDCAKVHLYDETGAPLGKVRVYQVHTA